MQKPGWLPHLKGKLRGRTKVAGKMAFQRESQSSRAIKRGNGSGPRYFRHFHFRHFRPAMPADTVQEAAQDETTEIVQLMLERQ
jgi:hypothetical protein